jgi:hypothetical protein
MRPSPSLLLAALLAALACGCAPDDEAGTITPDRFVGVNVELRLVDAMEDTEAGRDSLRREVLERHGVTPADLEAFVEARADRPAELAGVWRRITEGVDSARVEMELPADAGRPRVPRPD